MHIPFVQDYWIGRTFVLGVAGLRPFAHPAGVEMREMAARDVEELLRSEDAELRGRAAKVGRCCRRFGAWMNGRLVGVCTFGFGEEYRGYYRLRQGEAELTDIFTTGECRGKGIATALISSGAQAMLGSGFRMLYAKVWHNNHPSTKAFVKAGWTKHDFFVRVQPVGTEWSWSAHWPPFQGPPG